MEANVLFRTYSVFEIIDQETGEIVYKETSDAKESESIMDVLGHGRAKSIENKLLNLTDRLSVSAISAHEPSVVEPEVNTEDVSEEINSVVYGDDSGDIQEKDSIFADMSVIGDDVVEDTSDKKVLENIDEDALVESLASNPDEIDAFGELSNMSFDVDIEDSTEKATDESNTGISDETPDKFESENIEGLEESNDDSGSDEDEEGILEKESYKSRIDSLGLDNLFGDMT